MTEPSALDSQQEREDEPRIRTLQRDAGGVAALAALTVGKLSRNERLRLEGIPPDARPAVAEIARLVDEAVLELFGDLELRTAARRVLGRAATADPSIVRRPGNPVPLAAAVTWIVAKANDCFTKSSIDRMFFSDPSGAPAPEMRVKDLAAHFGLKGSPSTRAATVLTALGRTWPGATSRDLGDASLLTSTRRAAMIRQRDLLRVFDA